MEPAADAAVQREAVRQHRAKLGTLQDLQVAPTTQRRYADALRRLWSWMQDEGLTIPDKVADFDAVVSRYIEHLWCDGAQEISESDYSVNPRLPVESRVCVGIPRVRVHLNLFFM